MRGGSSGATLGWRGRSPASHFDVITKYHAYRERGPYETEEALDHEPYPEEWLIVQQSRPSPAD